MTKCVWFDHYSLYISFLFEKKGYYLPEGLSIDIPFLSVKMAM
jgi:hypothetical protein